MLTFPKQVFFLTHKVDEGLWISFHFKAITFLVCSKQKSISLRFLPLTTQITGYICDKHNLLSTGTISPVQK